MRTSHVNKRHMPVSQYGWRRFIDTRRNAIQHVEFRYASHDDSPASRSSRAAAAHRARRIRDTTTLHQMGGSTRERYVDIIGAMSTLSPFEVAPRKT